MRPLSYWIIFCAAWPLSTSLLLDGDASAWTDTTSDGRLAIAVVGAWFGLAFLLWPTFAQRLWPLPFLAVYVAGWLFGIVASLVPPDQVINMTLVHAVGAGAGYCLWWGLVWPVRQVVRVKRGVATSLSDEPLTGLMRPAWVSMMVFIVALTVAAPSTALLARDVPEHPVNRTQNAISAIGALADEQSDPVLQVVRTVARTSWIVLVVSFILGVSLALLAEPVARWRRRRVRP